MEWRRAEVWKDGDWVEVPFMSLKKGDLFRLFESTGEPAHAAGEWTAESDAYVGERGIGTIQIKD